ncbi:MAG: hypothetical protein VX689_02300 [Bacteroidota bacterium]|nr:hypothetical protein [Bacteroidota bacterium]
MKRTLLFLFGIFICLTVFIFFFPCSEQVDVVDLKFNRFEQDLFLINEDNVVEKVNNWDKKFGSFNEVFKTQIMQLSSLDKQKYYAALLAFIQNKDMSEAYDSTSLLFSEFIEIERALEYAFSRFSNAFPSYPTPDITTFFGGFNYGVVTYDDNIAIGLENFLGKDSKYYKYLGDPKYLRFQKQKKFILSNVMEVWFNEHFHQCLVSRDFLSQMIYKGKMMYFLDKMLPELDMQDKFRFSSKHMDWVEKNEASIWQYFVHEDLLFSKKESEFRSFINYAPFARGMPQEAPGRVAYYTGYKIVSEYMKNNKIDMHELMFLTDSRKFLRKSRYKPDK